MDAIRINPKDIDDVKKTLARLSGDEANKAMVRGINKTLTGVRTDGVKILKEHYALTATAIRKSWSIRKAAFKDPYAAVSSKGAFIRLYEFGAKQNSTGVSVKVLQKNPRATIEHAFIAKLGAKPQVYWRKYKGARKKPVAGRAYARMPRGYRFPIKALYGPRIQDYLGDSNIIGTLQKMAGERLTKNMEREVNYLLSQAK